MLTANTPENKDKRQMENRGDFLELVDFALECGASDAVLIDAGDVLFDPRVRFKCLASFCFGSGKCDHCPPNGYSIEEMQNRLSGYSQGIFFRLPVESRYIASPLISKALVDQWVDASVDLLTTVTPALLTIQIAVLLEKRAREMGLKATGFPAGNCKDVLCFFHSHCMALISKKKGCRHPDLSRPSMESCGMDVFTMAANAGWDTYPIGGSCQPEDIPQAMFMGLVMLGKNKEASLEYNNTGKAFAGDEDHHVRTKTSLGTPFKNFSNKMKIYREKNVSLQNFFGLSLWSERRQLVQVLKNFHQIEGSWLGAFKQMKDLF